MCLKTILIGIIAFNLSVKSEEIDGCECSEFVNLHGRGNCLETKPDFCYLKEDSSCPDSTESKLYPGKSISVRACKLRNERKSTSNGSERRGINHLLKYVVYQLISCRLFRSYISPQLTLSR